MTVFAVEYVYDPDLAERRDEYRPAHRQWLGELVEAGVLLASGPYLDGSGGLFAFVAADEAALHKVLAQDPFALHGCVAGTRTTGWNPVTGLLKEYAQGA
ncbi:MAG: hypothetical protein IIZ13_11480 [Renibacterium sp.]|nr:hypothetical protein [Renibacterium sp.]